MSLYFLKCQNLFSKNLGLCHAVSQHITLRACNQQYNRKVSNVVKSSPTIFATSSGSGKCGVCVIRVSGQGASEAIQRLSRIDQQRIQPRQTYLKNIYHPGSKELLDKGLIIWFPAPHSFSGEDCCEFQVHGGPAVKEAVLDALQCLPGFRHAEPGEFTRRAFLNGKLDLTEVEGLGDLIHAETEQQRRQAVRQMDGQLSKLYSTWKTQLLKCVANVEAYIDFSEDELIEDDVLDHVTVTIASLTDAIERHLNDNRRGERLRSGVHICIIGEPNVGKSSLLNYMTQRDAAIVSPIAGTTRDVVETAVNLAGYPVLFSDTAGLRHSTDVVEQEGVRRALDRAKTADLKILVLDSTSNNIDEPMEEFIPQHMEQLGIHTEEANVDEASKPLDDLIVIWNKTDLAKTSIENSITGNVTVCNISCVTGEGMDNFLGKLKEKVARLCSNPDNQESPSLTQARHRHHLQECLKAFHRYQSLEAGDLVLAAQQLRVALHQLGKITGKISSEDILDVVFKDFCIGK